jgi:hypothetical protein
MCAIGASTRPGDHPADGEARDEERRERADREAAQVAGASLVHLMLERARVDERALLGLAAVVDRHPLDHHRLRHRLVPEAEREPEIEARDEQRGDAEEDAGVEQRQPDPDRAQECSSRVLPEPVAGALHGLDRVVPASLRRSVITVTRTSASAGSRSRPRRGVQQVELGERLARPRHEVAEKRELLRRQRERVPFCGASCRGGRARASDAQLSCVHSRRVRSASADNAAPRSATPRPRSVAVPRRDSSLPSSLARTSTMSDRAYRCRAT